LASGITAAALAGASGNAGSVMVNAASLHCSGRGADRQLDPGRGNGGDIAVTTNGALTLTGTAANSASAITAAALAGASGSAGSVTVTAPQASVTSGAQISSTTAGTGQGGLGRGDDRGRLAARWGGRHADADRGIGDGAQSGPGGRVTVSARNLTIEGGAQIASSTAGPGNGGDIASQPTALFC